MKLNKKFAALTVASAMVAVLFTGAQAAQADPISGAAMSITPTSGNVNTDTVFLQSISTTAGAPAGFRDASGTVLFQNGALLGSVATVRTASTTLYGQTGLTGNPVAMDRTGGPNNFVSNKLINATNTPLVSGAFELRMYFFANLQQLDYVNDKYISLAMTYDATSGAWSTVTPATPTTTSITAGATGTDVALSATVKKASDSTTATAAAGNIVFKEGVTTVATVPVASGVASTTLSGVAYGNKSYTAEFVPSNAYGASTSAPATVNVIDPNGNTKTTNVTTSVAPGAGGGVLTLTGVPATVALGAATLSGTTLNASGTLTAVVTDSRQLDYAAWSLTGQIGDFTSGTKTLSGKYLGWTPSVTGAPNSVAGAIVLPAPAAVNGLKTISTLATGAPNEVEVSNVSALLQLKAPKNTPAGAYSATLTLTLI